MQGLFAAGTVGGPPAAPREQQPSPEPQPAPAAAKGFYHHAQQADDAHAAASERED